MADFISLVHHDVLRKLLAFLDPVSATRLGSCSKKFLALSKESSYWKGEYTKRGLETWSNTSTKEEEVVPSYEDLELRKRTHLVPEWEKVANYELATKLLWIFLGIEKNDSQTSFMIWDMVSKMSETNDRKFLQFRLASKPLYVNVQGTNEGKTEQNLELKCPWFECKFFVSSGWFGSALPWTDALIKIIGKRKGDKEFEWKDGKEWEYNAQRQVAKLNAEEVAECCGLSKQEFLNIFNPCSFFWRNLTMEAVFGDELEKDVKKEEQISNDK